MRKIPARPIPHGASAQAARSATQPGSGPGGILGLRAFLIERLAMFAVAPLIGLFAGFVLLFGGIFLSIAWTVGPKVLLDAHQYAPFTARADGHIVESWVALEFDPSVLPQGKLYWQPWSKVTPCAVVEYGSDWGAPLRRGFCGNRFDFRDDFRLDDWQTLMPDVPFSFARDANGFAIQELRLGKTALDWLSRNPPHDTFMLPKPPPTTALGALKHQFDAPLDVALSSWTTPVRSIPLAYDPRHPEAAVPAKIVENAHRGDWWLGLIFALIFVIPGLFVFRVGLMLLTGQSGALLWVLTLAALAALPWWGELLPRVVAQANKQWAGIASDMLDDISRVTRFTASAPSNALLRDGERLVWTADAGDYADTFGRLHFTPPNPAPKSDAEALAELRAQVTQQVGTLDSTRRAELFRRLRRQYEAGLQDVQRLFTSAAEDTLRDARADATAHEAARNFLIFASGGTYYEDQLDKIEVRPQ
jgi:hypothetical protein